jgi:hypothetical protein
MALFKQAFTRAGAAPDLGALANTLRPTLGDPFYLNAQLATGGVVTVFVEKPTVWTGPQTTAVQSAITAAADATPQSEAQNAIDNMAIFDKAILLALLDQINVIRAALPSPLGAITPAQAAAAVRAKAATL